MPTAKEVFDSIDWRAGYFDSNNEFSKKYTSFRKFVRENQILKVIPANDPFRDRFSGRKMLTIENYDRERFRHYIDTNDYLWSETVMQQHIRWIQKENPGVLIRDCREESNA